MRERGNRRIVLFFSNLSGGGIQRVMLSLAEGMLQAGWQVDLLVLDGTGPLAEQIPPGCRLLDFSLPHVYQALPNVVSYLRSSQPEVLFTAQTHYNLAAMLSRVLSGWKGRLILSEHINLSKQTAHSKNMMEQLYPTLARWFYPFADKVVVVSQDAADDLVRRCRLPASRVTVIHNPVLTRPVETLMKPEPEPPWPHSPSAPLFLAAGRLTPQKNFPLLLQAFTKVLEQEPAAHLVILGEGEDRLALSALAVNLGIHGSVWLPGFVPNPYPWMARCSVFVLSSSWEGFGNVLVEAMACGTPVVATDCPSGPAEILEKGRLGRLVPPEDAAALAAAMLAEWRSPHQPHVLKQRAADFTLDAILPKYLALFDPQAEQEQ
ncbi:MAG: glycosyltransferase [Anaerolineae bacterium]|nr:glycosyltransferase [Anaerolineae bacterium]